MRHGDLSRSKLLEEVAKEIRRATGHEVLAVQADVSPATDKSTALR